VIRFAVQDNGGGMTFACREVNRLRNKDVKVVRKYRIVYGKYRSDRVGSRVNAFDPVPPLVQAFTFRHSTWSESWGCLSPTVGHFEGAKVPNFDDINPCFVSFRTKQDVHPIRTKILSEKASYNFQKFGKTYLTPLAQ